MNRLHRELRDELRRKLNEVVAKIVEEAEGKGVPRHEALKMVKEFLRAPYTKEK